MQEGTKAIILGEKKDKILYCKITNDIKNKNNVPIEVNEIGKSISLIFFEILNYFLI